MDTKLITYAIPCYNSAEYMDACIESILACNRPDDIEIIVVDDGSTMTTPSRRPRRGSPPIQVSCALSTRKTADTARRS